MDFKLELVVIPVSDVDRAKEFYTQTAASHWRSTGLQVRERGSFR